MQEAETNVGRNRRILDWMVLEAVSHDYAPLETIVANLEDRKVGTSDFIRDSLLALLAREQVGAYLLHAESPFYTAITATEDTLDRYWFFITDKGDRELRNKTKN